MKVSTLAGLFRLFYLNSKIRIARSMQYRFDFFAGLIVSLTLSCIGPMIQYLIFTRTNGYPSWNINQIILFQGMLLFWLGLKDMLFGEVRNLTENLVRKGEFDRLLLKPYPSIGILLSSGFYYYGIGSVLAGLGVIIYSVNKLNLHLNLYQIGLFIAFIICGITLYMAVTVIYCTIVIMVVNMGRIGEITDKILRFSEFPVEIFAPVTRLFFITVIPFAVWVYFPVQALLNRLDLKAAIGALFCFLVFLASLKVWNIFLKKYTSAGG